MDKPLKKYIVDMVDVVYIIEASVMNVVEGGVWFENVIIRGGGGDRIGVGKTFIEHSKLAGVTLIEQEFGGLTVDNDTRIELFSVVNDDK
jgi:hypothetical protein